MILRPGRAGFGMLLWIGLVFIGALAVMGLVQRTFSSHVNQSVSRSMAGELALSLGQSALEESMHHVRQQANDPTSTLFLKIRKPVPAPAAGAFPLTPYLTSTEASRLKGTERFANFDFSPPQGEVVYQRQFEDLPYERFGLMHYWTRVSGTVANSDRVVREVHAYQEFKEVLITTPRPFDELPLYIGRASALTDLAAANRNRQTLLDLYGQGYDALKRVHDALPAGHSKDLYTKMLTEARTPAQLAASAPPVPEEPDAHVTGVWLTGQSFYMDSMDLANRLSEALPGVQSAIQAQATASTAALAAPTDDGVQAQMMTATSAALSPIFKAMLRVWSFALFFKFIPPSAPEYQSYEARARARLGYEHFRRLAFFVLRENPSGGPSERIQAQWDRLIKRVASASGQPQDFNGVVLVENQTEPLVLSGDVHGKLIVAATKGGLTLSNVNPHAARDESLVAVSIGGPLDVSGTVNAVLVATPYESGTESVSPTVRLRADAKVNGGLFVPLGATLNEWHGVLQYDQKYFAGRVVAPRAGWPDHYYVGVSPRTVFQTVTRQ